MSEPLKLSEFIARTAVEIAEGVRLGRERLDSLPNVRALFAVSPDGKPGSPYGIEFDVAVVATTGLSRSKTRRTTGSADMSIYVAEAKLAGSSENAATLAGRRERSSRVRFTVPMQFLPHIEQRLMNYAIERGVYPPSRDEERI